MSIKIRIATRADAEDVVTVWEASGLVTGLNDPLEDFERALSSPAAAVFIAQAEPNHIVGSVIAAHDSHRGHLYYMSVIPSFRRQKIASALVKKSEEWLRKEGIRKIHLLILRTNIDVMSFYETIGYQEGPAILIRKWLALESANSNTR